MDISKLIGIADEAYGDGVVSQYYEDRDGNHGDTLAKFVAVEIEETFDPSASDAEQIATARHQISNAIEELQRVHDALYLNANATTPPEKELNCRECGRETDNGVLHHGIGCQNA